MLVLKLYSKNIFIMLKKVIIALMVLFVQLFTCEVAQAGADLWGTVQKVQIGADGKLWFSIDTANVSAYCKALWFNFNMYIPPESPQYAFYYGLLMTALVKQKTIIVANISVFDGTVACDVTKTSYGIVISK